MLAKVKLALRQSRTTDFDDEIRGLIAAAQKELELVGIQPHLLRMSPPDPLVAQYVITYCRAHFGSPEPQEYDRLKLAYDEQKAQLMMASGYRREVRHG